MKVLEDGGNSVPEREGGIDVYLKVTVMKRQI